MQFTIVDVFAEGPYTGNQLAVFQGEPPDDAMQRIAQEMNFSETTFITTTKPVDGGYPVRIFTPANELRFAGHPTLGTAFVIREELMGEPVDQVILNEKVGPISVTFADDGFVWMRQRPPQFGRIYDKAAIASLLNLTPDAIRADFPVQAVSTGMPYIIVPLKNLDAVKKARVDVDQLRAIIQEGGDDLNADAVFVFSTETYHKVNDVNARTFVHLHGIPEDPATGSANGCFAGYLAKHSFFGSNIVKVRVEQGYEINRPSLLLLDSTDKGDTVEVNVGGRVRLVARGQWLAAAE